MVDGDRFVVVFKCPADAGWREVLAALGWKKPVASGSRRIHGEVVDVLVTQERMELSVSGRGPQWEVLSEGDFQAAKALEAAFDPVANYIVDPPLDDPGRCLCPAHHPDAWRANGL